ncbi:hypothetical protein AERO9A_420034 [Aeromonas salmonicida]|nr:hypothetical protein AERO9A_420034 [Aeromonas salmonicida]
MCQISKMPHSATKKRSLGKIETQGEGLLGLVHIRSLQETGNARPHHALHAGLCRQ